MSPPPKKTFLGAPPPSFLPAVSSLPAERRQAHRSPGLPLPRFCVRHQSPHEKLPFHSPPISLSVFIGFPEAPAWRPARFMIYSAPQIFAHKYAMSVSLCNPNHMFERLVQYTPFCERDVRTAACSSPRCFLHLRKFAACRFGKTVVKIFHANPPRSSKVCRSVPSPRTRRRASSSRLRLRLKASVPGFLLISASVFRAVSRTRARSEPAIQTCRVLFTCTQTIAGTGYAPPAAYYRLQKGGIRDFLHRNIAF